MRVFDLSPTLTASTGVFPGDVPFRRVVAMSFEAGHHLTLSSIQTTLHVGAHADAASHYSADGEGIDHRDPSIYIGPALVVRAKVSRGARITEACFDGSFREALRDGKELPGRLLVWTGTFPDPQSWNSDFASFDSEFIEQVARLGVRLIGIDTPSIDPETSKALESHQAVRRLSLGVLEGLCLDSVPEGLFTLLAQPVKIGGGDAGFVRALLLDGKIVDASGEVPSAFTWIECENKQGLA
jgi:arylformamidase